MNGSFRALTFALVSAAAVLGPATAHAIYGVQAAINDALSDDLKYVGKFVPHGSESGKRPVCVYRGKKVLVYSSYCVKYKVGAVGIRIHSIDPARGSVQIYAEARDRDDINKVKRDRYSDYGFSIATYDKGTFVFDGSMAKLKAYDTKLALSPGPECQSSRAFPKVCKPAHSGDINSWGDEASDFWNKPTANWYRLINLMKSKVP